MVLKDDHVCFHEVTLTICFSNSFYFCFKVRRTLHLGLNEEERAEVLGAGKK